MFEKTSSYTYYRNGMKKTFTGPDGINYTYTYDNNNQLTGVNIPGAGYITYSAYKWNRPTEVMMPGGSRRQYEYDPLMRVKSIAAKDPAQNILLNYQYNYDRMDNITAKVTEHGEYGYGYDDLYRLANAQNPMQPDEGFTYDSVGNRLTAEGVADDWSYNDNNELQGYAGITFEYDANGNMIKKTDAGQVTNYIYNLEDRLERVEDGSGSLIATYYYDPFGRRLWKEVDGVQTYFVYADEGLVAEVGAAGSVTKSYGYRPGSTWTTDPLFMKVAGQYYFYQNDHLGTTQKLTLINGAVVWSAKYSSFGQTEVDPSSSVTNNMRFPGQYYDQETGLHYNYFRYFLSTIGRYLRLDPIGFLGGDSNLYNYVLANPVRMTDIYGLANAGMAHWSYNSQPDPKDFIHLAPDPNNIPSAGFTVGLNAFEIIQKGKCMYFCWSLATEAVGVHISDKIIESSKYNELPVTIYFGVYKNLSLSTDGNSINGSVGFSVSPPLSASARILCVLLTKKSRCSDCQEQPTSFIKKNLTFYKK
jgi:RHS repeat-associated protein